MDIAIIGAGNVGKALASSLARAGHDVTVRRHQPGARAATPPRSRRHAPRHRTTRPSTRPTSSSSPFRPPPSAPRRGDRRRRRPARSSSTSPTGPPRIPPALRHLDRRGAPGAAAGQPGRQGVQHRLRLAPGRSDRRRASRRRLRRRRRRSGQADRPRRRRVDRLPAGRRRIARGRSNARGHGLAEHQSRHAGGDVAGCAGSSSARTQRPRRRATDARRD